MKGDSTLYFKNEMEKNPINQTQAGCFVDAIKNKTLYERPHHNRVLDIFDTSNLLKSFWNVFPCIDVSFWSVREYTLSLIYTALRVVHLFFLFFGLSFQKKTSCHKFHTIHGYKRSLVIRHNLPHETRFRFLQIPISTDDLRYWDISSITSQLWLNDRKWNHCDVISCYHLDYLRQKMSKWNPPVVSFIFHLFFVNVHLKISNIWRHYNDLAQESYDKVTE